MKLLITVLLLFSPIVWSAPSINQIAKDYEETKKKLVTEEIRQRKIMSSLFDINRKMKKIVTEKADLIQEKMVLESSAKELAGRIVQLEEKVKTLKSFLRERLSVIYKFSGQGVVRFLFSSATSAELERNLKVLGIVAKRDLELLKDFSQSVKELGKKKEKLTLRLAHLKKVEANINTSEQKLTFENNLKNKILDKIRNSKKFALSKLLGLREKTQLQIANDDSGVLDLLFRPSFFEQKGQLSLPTRGYIAQRFGLIRDTEQSVVLSHKGLFIAAPMKAPVKAVFSGVVSFADSVPGYGPTLIIDHGDHYYTVYGHAANITVKEGDEIQQNQVIASVGNTSEEFGTGIYFEIRHFSEPYDPQAWMKGN